MPRHSQYGLGYPNTTLNKRVYYRVLPHCNKNGAAPWVRILGHSVELSISWFTTPHSKRNMIWCSGLYYSHLFLFTLDDLDLQRNAAQKLSSNSPMGRIDLFTGRLCQERDAAVAFWYWHQKPETDNIRSRLSFSVSLTGWKAIPCMRRRRNGSNFHFLFIFCSKAYILLFAYILRYFVDGDVCKAVCTTSEDPPIAQKRGDGLCITFKIQWIGSGTHIAIHV